MSEASPPKPLKTWPHLAARRRKPSEYEIVSTNLHYSTRGAASPWELSPNLFMNRWYERYRNGSQLTHHRWNDFRDPDELVYRTYNLIQDGQETYVYGLFDHFNQQEHDKTLEPSWVNTLARLYTPARYVFHALQLASAYVGQMAPASTITNCAYFQMADSFRWLSHTAYRTKELSNTFSGHGFVGEERQHWENDSPWQGFRELIEKLLVTWDWGEAFVALNLISKPAVEESVIAALGEHGRRSGDILLGLLASAQLADAARHRRWTTSLVTMAIEEEKNRAVIANWIKRWEPLADQAIAAYCDALTEPVSARQKATQATRAFRNALQI